MGKLIKPNWVKDAVTTTKGWVNSRGSLVLPKRISEDQIAEYHGVSAAPVVQTLMEAPAVEQTLTESQVEHYYQEATEED